MGVGCFLYVRVLDNVTVEMNQAEEVETQRRSKTTQHPAWYSTTSTLSLLMLKQKTIMLFSKQVSHFLTLVPNAISVLTWFTIMSVKLMILQAPFKGFLKSLWNTTASQSKPDNKNKIVFNYKVITATTVI